MPVVRSDAKPLIFLFEDDGLVPNNRLPLLIYKQVIDFGNEKPEEAIEQVFGANGWRQMWRNGIFDYLHYHATVHEALGVSQGKATVRFGGDRGETLELASGDVAILPGGTGHQCLKASSDFCVVGAYPPGPQMQVTLPTPANHVKALKSIPAIKVPERDPLLGDKGPLVKLWAH